MMKRLCLVLFLLSCVCPAFGSDKPREFDFGFIASRLEDPSGSMRLKILGPIYERALATNGAQLKAVRPIYSSYTDPVTERHRKDIVWPLASAERFRQEFKWRVLLTWYLDRDRADPKSKYHFWSLPFYFQGRDEDKRFYMAVFPLGGCVRDILGLDETVFVLFPLYARSHVNEVETWDILWPIFSHTEGKGIHRNRVFPLYGRNIHRDKYEKRFILWPLWTSARYKYPRSYGTAYVLWPLWGHVDLNDQKAWLFIPPFIRFSSGQRLNHNYCPWPFVQWSSGEVEKFYLWPIWGEKNTHGGRSAFFLWPIFRTEQRDRGDAYSQQFLALPFLYSEVRRQRSHDPEIPPKVIARHHKLWPLLSYTREGDSRRFRCLDIWPLKDTGAVEREYAPIWTLFSHTAVGSSYDDELLWGLYRCRKRGSEYRSVSLFPVVSWTRDDRERVSREWSILKGLLRYKREGTQKSLCVLYFLNFGGKEKKP